MTDSKNVDIHFPASATDVRRVAVAASSSQFNFADLTVPLPRVVRPAAVARNPQRFASSSVSSSSAASAEHASSHQTAAPIAVASAAASAPAPAPASAATHDRGDSSAGGASIARRSALLDAQMAELFDYIGIVACRSPHMLSALNREAAESTSSSSSSSSLAASISSELSAFRCFGASPDDDESHLDVACGYHGVSFRWRGLICPHTIAQLLSACRCACTPAF
jgi:hypothetical protein